MDEGGLVSDAFAGDTKAFAALVQQHQSGLRGFLRRLTKGNASLADDLAQETFLEAWRKLAQLRERGTFAGWLFRIAWSRFLMDARRRKLEPLADIDGCDPVESGNAADVRLDLEHAMRRLSALERAALTLCYAYGYSNEEASRILDLPVGTLKSHVLRGREKLKAVLEGAS